jgi:hypothetical protein
LTVTIDGETVVGIFNMTGDAADQWYKYSGQFTGSGSAPTFSISDSVTQAAGNDFALDDITITTPEPAAWMFAAGGAALMFLLRRVRKA